MSYLVRAVDETWGTRRVLSERKGSTYADAKALVCHTLEIVVKDLIKFNQPYRYRTLPEVPGESYTVVLEWCPDGELVPESGPFNAVDHKIGLQQAVVMEVRVA